MPSATLTSKGQTTIPLKIRELFGLKTGDRLDFVIRDNGEVLVKPAQSDVTALRGLLARKGRKPVSVENMNRALKKKFGK